MRVVHDDICKGKAQVIKTSVARPRISGGLLRIAGLLIAKDVST